MTLGVSFKEYANWGALAGLDTCRPVSPPEGISPAHEQATQRIDKSLAFRYDALYPERMSRGYMNAHNRKLAAAGKKRRAQARALRRAGFTVAGIALGWQISRARVYQLLKQKP